MAFVAPYMGDLILSIALSIFGMVGGPICGLVASGIFMPCVNPWVRYDCNLSRSSLMNVISNVISRDNLNVLFMILFINENI